MICRPELDLRRPDNAPGRSVVGLAVLYAGLRGHFVGLEGPSMSSWRPSICPREHSVGLRVVCVTLEGFLLV